MKRLLPILAVLTALLVVACGGSNAQTVDENLKKEADKFNLVRSVVVTNGITNNVIYYVEGRCAFFDHGRRVDVVCREGADYSPKSFRKATIKMGDQDSAAVTQLEAVNVSEYRTKIIFRPEAIIPDLDLVTSGRNP